MENSSPCLTLHTRLTQNLLHKWQNSCQTWTGTSQCTVEPSNIGQTVCFRGLKFCQFFLSSVYLIFEFLLGSTPIISLRVKLCEDKKTASYCYHGIFKLQKSDYKIKLSIFPETDFIYSKILAICPSLGLRHLVLVAEWSHYRVEMQKNCSVNMTT